MYNPVASYRIQFNKDFSFREFEKIVPYLAQLGVSTVYASPLLESTPGSTHGYDAVNPHRIDPEIGDQESLLHLKKVLENNGIGWIQDIVPNHMAFDPNNPWLMDVLEKGQQSEYTHFFDIAWNSPLFEGKIMVPFLGTSLEEAIDQQELTIGYADERLVLQYHENNYPLRPQSYVNILRTGTDAVPSRTLQQFIEQVEQLKAVENATSYTEAWDELRLQWAAMMKLEETHRFISQQLANVNASPDKLRAIADQQSYRLCSWQETDSQINFRRFFTINGLICLNIQDEEVFNHYHEFIKTLVDAQVIQGLRIDHIDGLYDPTDYLEQLRKMVGGDTYVVVEKILEEGESLPAHWPVQGTTGYDFLAQVNNLFTWKDSEQAFTEFYRKLVGNSFSPAELRREKKEFILQEYMAGELENLYQLFLKLNLIDKKVFAAIHRDDMKDAIAEFLIQCPVYRYYGNQMPLPNEEAAAIEKMLFRVRRYDPDLHQAVNLLEEVLLRKPHQGDTEWNSRALYFYQRCMQFTGPLMAKGVEDTLMYVYNRFIGHNEVGDSPEAFGYTIREFHQLMQDRQAQWPLSLNATATHDTKRGEDSRARLNVLTDLPDEWFEKVQEWLQLTTGLQETPLDMNDIYFIYQTLVAAYPMPGHPEEEAGFGERLSDYLQKALREGKAHSNWAEPNETYEAAIQSFAGRLLHKQGAFWKSFEDFHQKVADFGILNSLAQTILKFTAPGVPDVYQGCELWDLSMVDPDNRRAVQFEQRQEWLSSLLAQQDPQALANDLWEHRFDGRIKLWLHQQLFSIRQQHPELFLQGSYLPLNVEGAYRQHVIAFMRQHRRHCTVVVVPLHTALLCRQQQREVADLDWKDTRIQLPEGCPDEWEALGTGSRIILKGTVAVQSLFIPLPFAILTGMPVNKERSAGILLHISSLASPFGIGDMGPAAMAFANFLERSNQRYWQLLPINPVEEQQAYSPYSATSSRAGNIWLISPELLAREGLLEKSQLPKYHLPQEGTTAYAEVQRVKTALFQQAYEAFQALTETIYDDALRLFCDDNQDWLDDFALYSVLKDLHQGKAWYQWPTAHKQRDPAALEKLTADYAPEILKVKWLQYVFFKQWKQLKNYCNKRDIEFLGDLPIYVSYDSVDVWVHRDLFHLDEDGRLTGIAGVPPDAFSADGQLWGMPVYRWEVLREQHYDWWIDRLRKNMELFDLVRLDHFRGFSSYWEVPGGEKNAVNGTWVPGPGADFFQAVEEALGHLPFVAEDLGDIDAAVLELRDQFRLPGMKVLHFAFSENMPQNEYIPHNHAFNFITYTGTHDNNTTRGWYRQDIDQETRQRLEHYVGHEVPEDRVHEVLARMAYASVAKIAILPIQDVLGLDEKARMNTPASTQQNWSWRLLPGQMNEEAQKQLRGWTALFNRD